MKLLKYLLAAGLFLTGCAAQNEVEEPELTPVSILSPSGAPALSLMETYLDKTHTVEYVTGSEVLSAELVKPDAAYDIIVAPVNLGTKMIEKGKSEYRLAAVITWGNLYLVGSDEELLTKEGQFAAFGEGSVPDMIFKTTVDVASLTPELTYYSSAQDVQAAILSGNADGGLLAEPAVTATIAKAKEKNIELKVIKDLQAAYQEKMQCETAGFPQAAIFVKTGSEANASAVLDQIEKFVNDTAVNSPDKIGEMVDEIGADVLGVPNAKIAQATWAKQNIHFTKASEVTKDLTTLLDLFGITFNEDMLSK